MTSVDIQPDRCPTDLPLPPLSLSRPCGSHVLRVMATGRWSPRLARGRKVEEGKEGRRGANCLSSESLICKVHFRNVRRSCPVQAVAGRLCCFRRSKCKTRPRDIEIDGSMTGGINEGEEERDVVAAVNYRQLVISA